LASKSYGSNDLTSDPKMPAAALRQSSSAQNVTALTILQGYVANQMTIQITDFADVLEWGRLAIKGRKVCRIGTHRAA
jgi:hypothetical protein